jgi:predicted phosphodiesterase
MVTKKCPHCGAESLIKKGWHHGGKQNYRCTVCGKRTTKPIIDTNKKRPDYNWREWAQHLQNRQDLTERASGSQDSASINIQTAEPYILFQPIGDTHFGNAGVDYKLLERFTDTLLSLDYMFTGLLGDMEDNFCSFKNQLPVLSQILSPAQQDQFLNDWLTEVKDKTLFATWGNHAEFQERATGRNTEKDILKDKVIYFNGIGNLELTINDIMYTIIATHKTRNNSMYNATHGLKQMARHNYPNADIYLAGHKHEPVLEIAHIHVGRSEPQIFALCGTLKGNDGYAKRYFKAKTFTSFPAFVFDTRRHNVIPFWDVTEAIMYIEGAKLYETMPGGKANNEETGAD